MNQNVRSADDHEGGMDVAKMGAGELHYVDIHEVISGNNAAGASTRGAGISRGTKRDRRRFSRQVSLGTGFEELNESRGEGKKVLERSGRSFGGFEAATTGAHHVGGRKGDFNLFRTKSGLSKQNSMAVKETIDSMRINEGNVEMDESVDDRGGGSVPAKRYFAALRGPELDQIKDYEDILLPKNEKWPFLLRFPIGCFGICLGLSSQAVLWRALTTSPVAKLLHITPYVNLSLWALASAVLIAVSATYILKCVFYFEAVRREFFHPVRINFFFAPWVVCMFLVLSAPPALVPGPPHPAMWCVLIAPYFLLELKIYGQWLSGGKRRLCRVANPSSHLSVVGNFVGAILAAKVGWKEPAKFFWAVGFAHYLVLFVTLYQRLPTSEALPKELHPVYSMFIAAPSAASIAWEAIYEEFDGLARTCYFIALFLYASLVVRINFFTGFRFSVAWWSYTFPMTTASVATLKYAEHEHSAITKVLALTLSFMSSTMVAVLCVCTLLHAFVWRTLFPNDLAIAITKKRQGKEKKPARTKQSPLSIVSSLRNQNSEKNKNGEDSEMRYDQMEHVQ